MSNEGRLIAGRYRLTGRIGSGAMGVVWQARDERLYRTVAIKQLLLQTGMSAAESHEARQRAMREGRIAARLQHPHAISVYDVVEVDGTPWLIMEYLPSKSLSAVLNQRGTLPPREAARVASQVASALDAAHAAGIVHRDIKPGNILLGDNGVVKITDFGISRATGDVTVTATGMLAGTPAYLAPEVAKGYDPGPPSDVFSLGSTIYATAEGEPPFGLNENTLALLHAVAAGQVLPPRQAGPLTPLLMQMLATHPEDRPTMGQAREALAAVAAGRPVAPLVVGGSRTTMQMGNGARGATGQRGVAGTTVALAQRAEPRSISGTTTVEPELSQPSRQTTIATPDELDERERSGPRKRAMILTAIGVVIVVVIGILVAVSFTNLQSAGQPGSEQQTSATAEPSKSGSSTAKQSGAGAQNSTSASASSSTNPSATSSTSPGQSPLTPQDMRKAIKTYFESLPADPDSAYAMLSSNMQSATSAASYEAFWSAISWVKATPAVASSDSVTTTVTYLYKNGQKVVENDTFTFIQQDGQPLIDSQTTDSRSVTSPTTTTTTTPPTTSSATKAPTSK